MSETLTYGASLSLHELATRLSAQISAADGEIDETRAILKDAIDRLIPAFVNHPNAVGTEHSAFSALQFQDLSDQQLAHAQQRLRAIRVQILRFESALGSASQLKQVASGATPAGSVGLVALVDDANDVLAALDLSLEKPVATPHLGTGEMELF